MNDIILNFDDYNTLANGWNQLISRRNPCTSGVTTVIANFEGRTCSVKVKNSNTYIVGFSNSKNEQEFSYKDVRIDLSQVVFDKDAISEAISAASDYSDPNKDHNKLKKDDNSFWKSQYFLILALIISESARFEYIQSYVKAALEDKPDLPKYSDVRTLLTDYNKCLNFISIQYITPYINRENKLVLENKNCPIYKSKSNYIKCGSGISDRDKTDKVCNLCEVVEQACSHCERRDKVNKKVLPKCTIFQECKSIRYRCISLKESTDYAESLGKDSPERTTYNDIFDYMQIGILPPKLTINSTYYELK